MGMLKRLSYILKYLLDFKNNLINIGSGCATLYHLSMTYITVYNLSININYRILAVELNYRFTLIFNIKRQWKIQDPWGISFFFFGEGAEKPNIKQIVKKKKIGKKNLKNRGKIGKIRFFFTENSLKTKMC